MLLILNFICYWSHLVFMTPCPPIAVHLALLLLKKSQHVQSIMRVDKNPFHGAKIQNQYGGISIAEETLVLIIYNFYTKLLVDNRKMKTDKHFLVSQKKLKLISVLCICNTSWCYLKHLPLSRTTFQQYNSNSSPMPSGLWMPRYQMHGCAVGI